MAEKVSSSSAVWAKEARVEEMVVAVDDVASPGLGVVVVVVVVVVEVEERDGEGGFNKVDCRERLEYREDDVGEAVPLVNASEVEAF